MLNPIDYSISKFISFADDDTVALIRDITETHRFKMGATIERRGSPVNHLYLIEKGLVQLGIDGIDGSRFNLARLGPGHTFGEAAFFLSSTATHDVHAKSDVVLQKLSRDNIDHLLTHSLSFSKALMAVASMRLETTLSYIGDRLGMPLSARVAKQILSVSASVNQADIISLRQIDLAHSLGVSRVSIGKTLKDMSRRNLIEIGYGKLKIVSRKDLIECVRRGQPQI